jgi:phosphatidylinositol-3-phosphatase
MQCGSDGCGGNCGMCLAGEVCSAGQCMSSCTPNCAGNLCGDDGCGGSCGTCTSGQTCTNGNCGAASSTAFDHLVIILMENHSLSEIYGVAPYMTQLADQYTLYENYSAITHPSEPNYLAIFGGDTFGVTGDGYCCYQINAPNTVDRLEANGLTWAAFAEDATGSGQCSFAPPRQGDHFQAVHFSGMDTAARCANFDTTTSPRDSEVIALLNTPNAPNYIWLTPNDNDNMHDTSVSAGDAYLANLVPQILSSTTFTNSKAALLITFDEGTDTYPQDWVYTVLAGPVVNQGLKVTAYHDHYSVLATLEWNWGFAPLGSNDASSTPMSEAFVNGDGAAQSGSSNPARTGSTSEASPGFPGPQLQSADQFG